MSLSRDANQPRGVLGLKRALIQTAIILVEEGGGHLEFLAAPNKRFYLAVNR